MKNVCDYLIDWCGNDSIKKYLVNLVLQNKSENMEKTIEKLRIIKNDDCVMVMDPPISANEKLKLCINSIKKPINIGALCNENEFNLGKKLNVFYGENGSGKSTYVKVFRKLSENYFTNAKSLVLKANVFKKAVSEKQTILVSYENGIEKVTDEVVDINSYHGVLSKINVFDSDSLQPLLNKDLTFSVLPKGMDIFGKLVELLEETKKIISLKVQKIELEKKQIFQDSAYTDVLEEIKEITTKVKAFEDVITFLDKKYVSEEKVIENKVVTDSLILQMTSMKQASLIKILNSQSKKLEEILSIFGEITTDFSKGKIDRINMLQKQYGNLIENEKRENSELAEKIKKVVVNEEWLKFLESARCYYDTQRVILPKADSNCIFCGQKLGSKEIDLLKYCFEHLESGMRKEKRKLELELKKEIPLDKNIVFGDAERELFSNDKEILLGKIEAVVGLIKSNIAIFKSNINKNSHIPETCVIDFTELLTEINETQKEIQDRLDLLNKSNGEIIEKITIKRKELRKWEGIYLLYQSLDKFKKWYQSVASIKEYTDIKRKTSTSALTTKSQEAFDALIGTNYMKLFNSYCQQLNIKNVNVKLTPKKGETTRSKYIVAENNAITEIMSEGEQKAIALAEFAVDLKIRENNCTILFDDPVTSFDYKRAEKIADIINELSKERQVIVFTHNIMFYYKMYSFIEKEKDKENMLFKVDEFDRDNKGIISYSSSGRLENLNDMNKRINNNAQEINSKKCVGDELERTLQITYSDIRTWCELMVEEGFLKCIIRRYEPNIRFSSVPKINGEFINYLPNVTKLFEKSCRYMTGHSQPTETLNIKPTREEFVNDYAFIKEAIDKFK